MNTKGFGGAVFVHGVAGLITIATSTWGVLANEPNESVAGQNSRTTVVQLAQAIETGCRQTNSVTGVYLQPSLESASRGVLTSGQTVRLELIGTGTGWARVTEPMIGWVEAKYLTPAVDCTGLSAAQFSGAVNGVGSSASATVSTPTITPVQPSTQTVAVVCEVIPTEGLVVRSEPSIAANTALYTLPKGAYQFQFTNNHLTTRSGNLERYWAYITAPYPGWISLGVAGGSFNLGGKECG